MDKKRQPSILGRIASNLRPEFLSRKGSVRERKDSDSISIRSVASAVIEQCDVDRLFPEAIRYLDEKLAENHFTPEQKTQIVKDYLKRSSAGPSQSLLVLQRLKVTGGKAPGIEVFGEIKVMFRSESVDWLKDFCRGHGFKSWSEAVIASSHLLLRDEHFQSIVIASLRSFTNNKFGLTHATDNTSVYSILNILLSASRNQETVSHSMQLLTVLSLMDPPSTHSLLIEGAMNAKLLCNHALLFQGIAEFISDAVLSEEFWVDYCVFMNTLVSTRDGVDDVDLRVHLRSLVFRGKARAVLEELYEQTGNESLVRQLEFFFDVLEQDTEILRRKNQKMGLLSVEELVSELSGKNGLFENTLCLLASAPKESFYLPFIHSILEESLLFSRGITPNFALNPSVRLDIAPLVSAFSDQQSSDSLLKLQEVSKKYDTVKHQKDMAEVAFADRMNKSRDEYEEKLRKSQKDNSELKMRLEECMAEINILKAREDLESKARIQDEPNRRDSIVGGIEFNDKTEQKVELGHGSVASVIPPPPPPPMMQSTQAASKVPPPPPPPGVKAAKPDVKRKVPNCKMRPLQWKKVAESKIPGTVWEGLDDLKWEQKLDLIQLEERFSLKNSQMNESLASITSNTSVNNYSFLSTKQSTNLEIALRKCKIPLKEASSHFLQMNEGLFNADLVNELLRLDISEQSRATALKEADSTSWSTAETFLIGLFKIPEYELRLKCFKYKSSFDEWSVLTRKCVRIAANKALTDAEFKKILELILFLGNYLNSGTFRGNAKGFEIDALSLLPTTKSADNKTAIIHSIAEAVLVHCPGLISNDQIFKEASNVNFGMLREELKGKLAELTILEDGLSSYSHHSLPGDQLQCKMLPLASTAKADLAGIQNSLKMAAEAQSKVSQLLLASADENPFSIISAFLTDLNKAASENKARLLEEAKSVRVCRSSNGGNVKSQASKIRAILETADDGDRNMVDGLLGALKM